MTVRQTEIVSFKGKDINAMTRGELLEVVKYLGRAYRDAQHRIEEVHQFYESIGLRK